MYCDATLTLRFCKHLSGVALGLMLKGGITRAVWCYKTTNSPDLPSVGLPSPPKAPEPRAPRGVNGGERPYGSKTNTLAISFTQTMTPVEGGDQKIYRETT